MTRPARSIPARPASPRAFTLIEILLAVLILAFGLLGLGAVIPVVLREQRIGSDATLGVAATKDALAYLERRADLMRLRHPDYDTGNEATDFRMGLGRWLLPPYEGTRGASDDPDDIDNLLDGADWSEEYLWEDWSHTLSTDYQNAGIVGDFTIIAPDAGSDVVIKLTDRLWPAPSATGAPPQFVWDFTARRVKTGLGEPRMIQVALFVRRIDPNIRVPRDQTLYDVLAAGDALPIAVDVDGLPTLNGVGDYAAPRVLDITFNPTLPSRIVLPSGAGDILDAVRQPGQKIVDNLGNIYTVRGLAEDDPNRLTLLIDPPAPVSARNDGPDTEDDARIRQILFTPQIPAAVTVFTLTPTDPS